MFWPEGFAWNTQQINLDPVLIIVLSLPSFVFTVEAAIPWSSPQTLESGRNISRQTFYLIHIWSPIFHLQLYHSLNRLGHVGCHDSWPGSRQDTSACPRLPAWLSDSTLDSTAIIAIHLNRSDTAAAEVPSYCLNTDSEAGYNYICVRKQGNWRGSSLLS